MAPDNNESIAGVEKKVDALSKEIASINKTLESLSTINEMSKKLDDLGKEVDNIREIVADVPKIDNITKAVESVGTKVVEDRSSTKDIETLASKIGEVGDQIKKVEGDVEDIKASKETEVLFKKIDDLLIAIKDIDEVLKSLSKSDEIGTVSEKVDGLVDTLSELSISVEGTNDSEASEVISKKIDDLQQYVAGLSALEEKVDDIASSFIETKEIVGIIVRQLDDIERKYNKAAEDIAEAVEILKSGSPIVSDLSSRTDDNEPEVDAVLKASASSVDELMKRLLSKVKPQTEAKEMAKALEEARDELTTMIKGHTPVLFQFGKRATELKSYPPTATLNENDIARLNKDLRDWTSKLKRIASEK